MGSYTIYDFLFKFFSCMSLAKCDDSHLLCVNYNFLLGCMSLAKCDDSHLMGEHTLC